MANPCPDVPAAAYKSAIYSPTSPSPRHQPLHPGATSELSANGEGEEVAKLWGLFGV